MEFFLEVGSIGLPAPGCFKAGPEQAAGGGEHLAGSGEGLGRRTAVLESAPGGEAEGWALLVPKPEPRKAPWHRVCGLRGLSWRAGDPEMH